MLYVGLGITTILILRKMSRRFRDRDVGDHEVPYGPRARRRRGGARGGGDAGMSDTVAVVLFLAVTTYAVFGGADFGVGFWDLVAGARDAGRALGRSSTAPSDRVEANHVWLIFVFVVLWTGFSEAYASITLTLFVPLTLAAFGIVLRGSSFVFRKTVFRTRDRRNFGAAFALSSVLVPYCMGAIAGGIASGRVPAGGVAGDPWDSWINPTSVLGGVLAVVVGAYLAPSTWCGTPAARATRHGGVLPPPRRRSWPSSPAWPRSSASSSSAPMPVRLRRAHLTAPSRSSSSPRSAAPSPFSSCCAMPHAGAPPGHVAAAAS